MGVVVGQRDRARGQWCWAAQRSRVGKKYKTETGSRVYFSLEWQILKRLHHIPSHHVNPWKQDLSTKTTQKGTPLFIRSHYIATQIRHSTTLLWLRQGLFLVLNKIEKFVVRAVKKINWLDLIFVLNFKFTDDTTNQSIKR